MKIVSWNLLHSVGARVDDIAAIIEQEAPDLFLMQEVTGAIGVLPELVGGTFYPQTWPGKRHGLAAWSPQTSWDSHPLKLPASKMPGRFPTRFAQILKTGGVTIANVHLSHGQILNRRQLYRIARSTDGPTAIVGDFNALGPVLLPGFFDVGPREITHHAQQVLPLRLDRCMARELKVVNSRALQRGPSDHRPILLRFQSNNAE